MNLKFNGLIGAGMDRVTGKLTGKVVSMAGGEVLSAIDKAKNAAGALGLFNKANERKDIQYEFENFDNELYSKILFERFLKTGTHHTNNYRFEFGSTPTAIMEALDQLGGALALEDYINMFCYNIDISSPKIDSAESRTFGEAFQMPVNVSYSPITMQFYCDREGVLYQMFNQWMGIIFDRKTRTLKYLEDYGVDLGISLVQPYVNKSGAYKVNVDNKLDVLKFTFEKLWPSSITAMAMNSTSPTVTQFNVEFNYRRMYVEKHDGVKNVNALGVEASLPGKSGGSFLEKTVNGAIGQVKEKALGTVKSIIPIDKF